MHTGRKEAVWITTFVICLTICQRHAYGGYLSFNTDFTNTTGSIVNDYHVKLQSTMPITISSTFQIGGNVVFNAPGITGNGTNTVQVDWGGATVNQGQTTHVGVSTGAYDPAIKIIESWWTVGGLKFDPHGYDGVSATTNFSGGAGFTVARITFFDSISGINNIGTEWMEGVGNLINVVNSTGDGPIFASVATLSSPTQIPLQNLNFSLTGFGQNGPTQQLNGVPEPSTLLLLTSGLAGLLAYRGWRRR